MTTTSCISVLSEEDKKYLTSLFVKCSVLKFLQTLVLSAKNFRLKSYVKLKLNPNFSSSVLFHIPHLNVWVQFVVPAVNFSFLPTQTLGSNSGVASDCPPSHPSHHIPPGRPRMEFPLPGSAKAKSWLWQALESQPADTKQLFKKELPTQFSYAIFIVFKILQWYE